MQEAQWIQMNENGEVQWAGVTLVGATRLLHLPDICVWQYGIYVWQFGIHVQDYFDATKPLSWYSFEKEADANLLMKIYKDVTMSTLLLFA